MTFNIKNLNIEISYYFLILVSLILSTDQIGITVYFFISILIHELGHLMVILFYKIKINKLSFKFYGIHIEIDYNKYLPNYKDIFILLSGSLTNFIVALSIYLTHLNLYQLIVTNIILGVFNLLPIDSLDGGKIMNIILFSFLPMKIAYNISLIISIIFISIFSIINFFFIIHGGFNLTLTILCTILILKVIKPEKLENR